MLRAETRFEGLPGRPGRGSVLKGASGLCSAPWGCGTCQARLSGRIPVPIDPGRPGPWSEVSSALAHTPGWTSRPHPHSGDNLTPASQSLLFYRKGNRSAPLSSSSRHRAGKPQSPGFLRPGLLGSPQVSVLPALFLRSPEAPRK